MGANTAALIAKEGFRVALVEKNREDARPNRCGCLVTPRVPKMVDAEKTIVGSVHGAVVHAPSGKGVSIDGRKTKAVVIDRSEFDSILVTRASDNGAKCLFGTRARDVRRKGGRLEVSLSLEGRLTDATCSILIASDGAAGNFARDMFPVKPRRLLSGCELTMSGVDGDLGFVKLFLGRTFAPGFFGWIIPCGETAKVGVCVDKGNARESLKTMMSRGHVREYLKNARQVAYAAGRTPIGFPRRTYAANFMAVGDAACQVKATSGGGLFPGLSASRFCAETAVKALEAEDFSSPAMRGYQKAWMKEIGKELRRDLAIHESFARLKDKHLEEVFSLLSKPETIRIIEGMGDIDFPSKVGWRLAMEEPRLLKYTGKALRTMLRTLA